MSLAVVKLGGSLAGAPSCGGWLEALAASRQSLVLVPGGGPFARAVRTAQQAMGFDDVIAHRLALRAMEQFAIALCACAGRLSRRLVPAASREAIAAALDEGHIPVWLPEAMALAAPEIEDSWAMTSDSLAAWLASDLHASLLLLIKSCDVLAASPGDLAARGVVDPLFPALCARSRARVFVAGPSALPGAAAILRAGGTPGVELVAQARGPAAA